MLPARPKYQECQKCGAIYPESERPDASRPTPCCGSDEALFDWPELTVATMLNLVAEQDLADHDKRKIAVVFLAAALEQLQDQAIMGLLLPKHIKTKEAAIALLDANEGRSRRSALIKKLSGKSLSEILQPVGLARMVNDWNSLAAIRNKVAHGNFFSTPLGQPEEIALIERAYGDCIPAFAAIHNHARTAEPATP